MRSPGVVIGRCGSSVCCVYLNFISLIARHRQHADAGFHFKCVTHKYGGKPEMPKRKLCKMMLLGQHRYWWKVCILSVTKTRFYWSSSSSSSSSSSQAKPILQPKPKEEHHPPPQLCRESSPQQPMREKGRGSRENRGGW